MADNDRLETLEFKFAHLERGVQELSDVVARQQRELDTLDARCRRLAEQLLEARQPAPAESDEVPPHY